MFSEMMAPPCEHVSRSYCPRLALATPLSKAPFMVTVGPLQRASHWAATVAGLILRTSPWRQQATVGMSLSHMTSPQGLPQKREACLTQIGMPLCCYSALVCGRHTTGAVATRSEPCLALLSCPGDPRRKNQCQRGEMSARGILT